MSDERKGLPSASSAQRYALCPGSFMLEHSVQEPDTTGADAQIGNRIHGFLAGDEVTLDETEQHVADFCRIQEIDLVKTVFPFQEGLYITRERRFWAFDDDFQKSWSGKPDVVYHDSTRALVIDYKTGRGAVEPAVGNLQLRALAVLVNNSFGSFSEITVAIIQPLAGEPTTCTYGAGDLVRAGIEINRLMSDIRKPGQPRNPSADACKYCRAKGICPEAQAEVNKLPTLVPRDGLEIVMTHEQIAEFLAKAPLAEAVIESVRGKARRMLEAGHAIPGWKLKPGSVRETIIQPETVFGRFVEAGGTQAQFVGAISITKTKLREAVKVATGRKGKELDAAVEAILDGCTESKQTAPSLVAEKEVA